jgi:hypothetical protein
MLLDSEEYLTNFGYNTVPYQRRRVLCPVGMKASAPSTSRIPATMLTTAICWASLKLFGSLKSSGLSLKTRKFFAVV